MIYLSIPFCIMCLYCMKFINEKYDRNPSNIHKVFILFLFITSLVLPSFLIYEILLYVNRSQGAFAFWTYILFYVPYFVFLINFTSKKK